MLGYLVQYQRLVRSRQGAFLEDGLIFQVLLVVVVVVFVSLVMMLVLVLLSCVLV